MPLERLKAHWHEFKESKPGFRFQDRYYRSHKRHQGRLDAKSVLHIAAGLGMMGLGVVMLVAPGPGIAGFIVGAGLLAGESLVLARLMDRGEVFLRRLWRGSKSMWRRMAAPARVLLVVAGGCATAAVAYGFFRLVFGG